MGNVVPNLDSYRDKYDHVKFRREDGILEVTLHTDGSDLLWSQPAHEEFGYLWEDIGRDPENKVIILTGSGDTFIDKEDFASFGEVTPGRWQKLAYDVLRLQMSHLAMEPPVIAAINGPATIHAEVGLLCDITLAAEHAYFADAPHAAAGLVPGDGVQVIWPLLLGFNRARYFLMTGQRLSAQEALKLGVINEVLPAADLLPRAWELARIIRSRPEVATRFTRAAMLHNVKAQFNDSLGYGLMLEGIATLDFSLSDEQV